MLPFSLEHTLEILLKKKNPTKQKTKQNPEERDVSLLSSLFEKKL